MLAIDWSSNLWKNNLNEPSNVSIPSLIAWFRCNYGEINNLLGIQLSLNPTTLELVDCSGNTIDTEAGAIYANLYLTQYYSRLIRNLLGVGDLNLLVSAESDGGKLTFVNRGNSANIYLQLRKDVEGTLFRLVNKYKYHNQTAVQVVGDDILTAPGSDGRLREQGVLYNSNNIGA